MSKLTQLILAASVVLIVGPIIGMLIIRYEVRQAEKNKPNDTDWR